MPPETPPQSEPLPQNEMERIITDAPAGQAPTEDVLRALVGLPVFIPSRQPVQADGAGLAPVVLTRNGTDYVAAYTSLERAGAMAAQARYCLQIVTGGLLPRLPPGYGVVINAGDALGFQIEPSGVQKVLEELAAPQGVLLSQVSTQNRVFALRFLPDGQSLVGGQSNGDVTLWHCRSALEAASTFHAGTSRLYKIALDPAGTRLATAGRGPLRLWWLPDGTQEQEFSFEDSAFTSATFSPDGARLLAAGTAEELRVVNVQTKTSEQDTGPGVDDNAEEGFWLRERSSSLVFHPNGQTLLVTSSSQGSSAVLFCDLHFGKADYLLTERNELTIHLPADVLSPAAFSPDGRSFAFADWDLHLYRFPAQERVASFDTQGMRRVGPLPDRGSEVVKAFWSNALFTPDGGTLICGSPGGDIFLWDVPSGDLRLTLAGHDGGVLALALDATGTRLASSGQDKTLRLWRLSSYTEGRV